MPGTPLTHNPLNGVTAGVWRQDAVVHKVLTRRRAAPPHWVAADDPRHWDFWRREACVHASALPERLGLGAPAARAPRAGPCSRTSARGRSRSSAGTSLGYGRVGTVDAGRWYAARAVGLGLCAPWAAETEELARELGR